MEQYDDGTSSYHFNKVPRKIYVTRSFPDRPDVPKKRYVSQVTDQDEGLAFATIKDEVVHCRINLHRRSTGRDLRYERPF